MSINIHGQDMVHSLGLVKVKGSMLAEKALQLIETKLKTYGLDLKTHIVSIISDGVAVMEKCVQLSGVNHQVCQSHGIHLAVCSVIYKYQTRSQDDDEPCEEMVDDDPEGDSDVDDNLNFEQPISVTNLVDCIDISVKKVRKIANFVKNRPVRNQVLQDAVIKGHRKELKVKVDVKTGIAWQK